jgi:uncharacterized delta-60 repeat protein
MNATVKPFDVAAIRRDFPILSREVYGKPLVYLDNGASAQKPKQVMDAMTRLMSEDYANVHRGLHYLANASTEVYEDARETVRAFLNAGSTEEIVFCRSSTGGLNMLASCLGRHLQIGAGDEIILSIMEHHSNIVPWHFWRERHGAVIKWAPVDDEGNFLIDEFAKLITPRTKVVSLTHMSNALGTIVPISDVAAISRAHGIPLVVDGSLTDADSAAVEAIAITALNTSLGSWQFSLDTGITWRTIDADKLNSATNDLALLLGPSAQIRLLPFGDLNGSLADAITFRAWDQTSGNEGQYVVITANGGTSAFSAAADTASVTVTAVNDAPEFRIRDGIAVTPIGADTDQARAVVVQPDGKILLAGAAASGPATAIVLVRYNPDGTLDGGFGGGSGTVTTTVNGVTDRAEGLALQADGKILVVGSSLVGATRDVVLLRYHADGTLDTSFGGGDGIVLAAPGPGDDFGFDLAVQADGRILVVGQSRGGGPDIDFLLMRFEANGTPDSSFGGGDGTVLTAMGAGLDSARAVAVQADGRILVAGLIAGLVLLALCHFLLAMVATTTVRPGKARLAATPNGVPTPMQPSEPGSR